MTVALTITASVSAFVIYSGLWYLLLKTSGVFYGLLIFELLTVIFLSAAINKISSSLATIVFILYSALNGITFSLIFLLYTRDSIASTFLVTALTFGAMSLYGYTTKKDLTTVGNIAIMGLFGIIIASIVNIFMANELTYWIITYIGVVVFVALTAYDTQKIKKTFIQESTDNELSKKAAIMGALILYLDFINLFLKLLRILGKKR